MDLTLVRSLIERHADRWRALGATVVYLRDEAQGLTVRCDVTTALADLTVWDTGHAQLVWGNADGGETMTEQYELTAEVGVTGLLEDLDAILFGTR